MRCIYSEIDCDNCKENSKCEIYTSFLELLISMIPAEKRQFSQYLLSTLLRKSREG